jgi:NFU1 iron-sulfur cluster scaffold homolog, mitochondrial
MLFLDTTQCLRVKKRIMTQIQISIETTPNPATMNFKFNEKILDSSYEFKNSMEAENSPLAAKLFGFPWMTSIMLGPDFISVTKQNWVDWEVLAEPLAGIILDHIKQDLPLIQELNIYEDNSTENENDLPIIKTIKRVLDNEIRPIVAYDGGDVSFASFESDTGKLYLKFKGACSGCPSKSITLKEGIEVRMKELIPEIQEVLDFNN